MDRNIPSKNDPIVKKRIELVRKYGLSYSDYPLAALKHLLENESGERSKKELDNINNLITRKEAQDTMNQ
jgi:hypothetical protein